MKPAQFSFWILLLLVACRKDNADKLPDIPTMLYTDFNEQEIKFGQQFPVDLDKNGSRDIHFFTLPVGDPLLLRDMYRYCIQSSIHSYFPVKDEAAPILNKGSLIAEDSFADYEWYNVSSLMLAQKVVTVSSPPFWEGTWRQVKHHFLPVRLSSSNQYFYGWVELSFDTAGEKTILHRAGISRQPDKAVKAGQ